MTHTMTERPPRMRIMWVAMPLFLAIALVAAIVRRTLAPDGALLVATVYAIGTIGMAWITRRSTEFRLVPWFATSTLMALALVLSAVVVSRPAHVQDLMGLGWMFPFLFLYLGITPGPKLGWCAPGSTTGGWLLVGIGSVYTTLLWVMTLLTTFP